MSKHKIGDLYSIVVKVDAIEDECTDGGYNGDVMYECSILDTEGKEYTGDANVYLDNDVLTKPLTAAAAKKITDQAIKLKIANVNERMALLKAELAKLTKQLGK